MFRYYETTPLEQFVERTYARHGIHTPQQLTVEELSNHLNIWIHYHRVRSRAVETLPGKYSIFLDNRLTPEKQWVEFCMNSVIYSDTPAIKWCYLNHSRKLRK